MPVSPLCHVAQILAPDGTHVGMATVVQAEERLLITCAHVVRNALREVDFNPDEDAQRVVRLRWPLAPTQHDQAEVMLEGWSPPGPDGHDGHDDLAVLRCMEAIPEVVTAAEIVRDVAVDGHRYHVYGATETDPHVVRATGQVGGVEGPGGGWIALHADPDSRRVDPGFSGTAVWDADLQYVLGIVVARERGGDGIRSFFIPGAQLATVWSRLDRALRSPFEISSTAREHWLPRARGVTNAAEDGWFFTGREVVIEELTRSIRGVDPEASRFFCVAGAPGAGKSGVLARLPVLADPRLSQFARRTYDDIGLAGVTVYPLYLREATTGEFFAQLSSLFGKQIESAEGLIDHIAQKTWLKRAPKILVFDGLDEAADETSRRALARSIKKLGMLGAMLNLTVVTSCRSGIAGSENEDLISTLGTRCSRLDVDSSRYVSRSDFERFVLERLLSPVDNPSPYVDDESKAERLARSVARAAYPIYMVAQLVTRSLIDDPELGEDELSRRVFPSTVSDAFDEYLAKFGADEKRARDLLGGLAHARGPGFTQDALWLTVVATVSGVRYAPADLNWVLNSAAAFLIESVTQRGATRYRLYHQALVDMLKAGQDQAVYETLVDFSEAATTEDHIAYLRQHLSGHALAAGRLSDLLRSPDLLVRCSVAGVVRDSSRPGVALPDPEKVMRAALISIQDAVNDDPAHVLAYLRMVGHQYDVPEWKAIPATLDWSIEFADWEAVSEHTVLSRSDTLSRIAFVRTHDEDIVVTGDSTGRIAFELADGAGSAFPPVGVRGSVTELAAAISGESAVVCVGSDLGEVTLISLGPAGAVATRIMRFRSPVTGLCVDLVDGMVRIVAGSADGDLELQTRTARRRVSVSRRSYPTSVAALTLLRGGRSLGAFATYDGMIGTFRLDDLEPVEELAIQVDTGVQQIFDSWYPADGETTVIASSAHGLAEHGLEFSKRRWVLEMELAGRCRASYIVRDGEEVFALASGMSLWAGAPTIIDPVQLRGHDDLITDLVVLDLSGKDILFSVSDDGTLRRWDLAAVTSGSSARAFAEVAVRARPFVLDYIDSGYARSVSVAGPPNSKDVSEEMHSSSQGAANHPLLLEQQWAQVSWSGGDEDYVICISDDYIDLGRVQDDEVIWLAEADGLNELGSTLECIALCALGPVVLLAVADASRFRVYDARNLELIHSIRTSGGKAINLTIDIARGTSLDTCDGAFALTVESGLLAGKFRIPLSGTDM